MAFDELEFVQWLREQHMPSSALKAGIGDDMAVVAAKQGQILVASDMLLDGVHFDSRAHSFQAIGRKAIARNLSDCAAMAVRPVAATVSLALPRDINMADAKALFRGMLDVAAEFELSIAGGDTARWANPLAIDIAIVAEPYEGIRPIFRSGACIGDRLYVTGTLGGSLLGRHMTFTPRVREARELAQSLGSRLHAMIDISDGLALDLWRICQASGAGAKLEEASVLAAADKDAKQAAALDGRSLLDHVLGDGEDHELLLAVEGAADASPRPIPLGVVTGSMQLEMHYAQGRIERIKPLGFVHQ